MNRLIKTEFDLKFPKPTYEELESAGAFKYTSPTTSYLNYNYDLEKKIVIALDKEKDKNNTDIFIKVFTEKFINNLEENILKVVKNFNYDLTIEIPKVIKLYFEIYS